MKNAKAPRNSIYKRKSEETKARGQEKSAITREVGKILTSGLRCQMER